MADEREAKIGDNSQITGAAGEQLKAIIGRIERLEDEKSSLGEDIKEIYAEAKANGFNTKIIRKVIARRKMDRDARAEMDTLIELYEGVFK